MAKLPITLKTKAKLAFVAKLGFLLLFILLLQLIFTLGVGLIEI